MSDAPGPEQAGPQTQLPEAPRPPLPPTAPVRGGPRARLLGIAGLVLTVLFLPAGLALSIAALVTGVRSRKRARRVLAPAPGAVAGIVLGTISLVLALSQIAVYAVAWDDLNGYVKCRESALTIEDKKTCQDEYLPRIEHRFHLPKDSLRRNPSWP